MKNIITLDYGSGGQKTSELIENLLLPALGNPALNALGDGAVLDGPITDGMTPDSAASDGLTSDSAASGGLTSDSAASDRLTPDGSGRLVFSTDSFVVSPWRFPGGDIGKLCVCGTVNDICMAGGLPKYLSLSFILEEGFPVADLEEIVSSVAREAKRCGIVVATGDTKVVEHGKGDGIYINTAGIGFLRATLPGKAGLQEGDAILLSGAAGCHGAAVMMARAGLAYGGAQLPDNAPHLSRPMTSNGVLFSDCVPLTDLSMAALGAGNIRILRDPTRGGVATALNEFVENSPLCIELEESHIPVDSAVESACSLLGLDPLYCACEGRMLAVVASQDSQAVLDALRRTPGGESAARIGTVTASRPGRVVLRTGIGGTRILQKLSGVQLPRIC